MRLIDVSNNEVVELPNELMWQDEYSWSAATANNSYSITGALLIEVAIKLSGRPITLKAADDMGWVSKTIVDKLRSWANTPKKALRLELQYPSDSRVFSVIFDTAVIPLDSAPVFDFVSNEPVQWYRVTLRLIEISN